jgi:uncharacterized protein
MKRTWKRIGWGVLVVLLALAIYGVFIEPRLMLDLQEEEAPVPGLPEAWVGREVAVLGDIQEGMWLDNDDTTQEAVARVVERRPAAVLLLGDFIYDASLETTGAKIAEALSYLAPIPRAGIPTFAVLGNHDYGMMTHEDDAEPQVVERVVEGLESIGVRVLQNEAVPLELDGGTLYLVGVDSHWAGQDRPLKALLGVPPEAPRLVMMHHPDSFKDFPEGTAPMAFAGHTHGGQIRIPFLPHWSWRSLAVEGEAPADGWVEPDFGQPGNRLYINRGIGMSTVPVRINCPPEVTMFTLRRGDRVPESDTRPAAARRGQGERR